MTDSRCGQSMINAIVIGPEMPITVYGTGLFLAGIRVDAMEGASTVPIAINMLILPDEGIVLTDDRQWNLSIDPSCSQTMLVSVPFRALAVGTATVAVDFYHGRRWLTTLNVSFEVTCQANDVPPRVCAVAAATGNLPHATNVK